MEKEIISEKKRLEIEKIRKEINSIGIESKTLQLIKNTHITKKTKDKINQYKLTVPLKFLELAGLNENNTNVIAYLNKQTNEINIQIKKYG